MFGANQQRTNTNLPSRRPDPIKLVKNDKKKKKDLPTFNDLMDSDDDSEEEDLRGKMSKNKRPRPMTVAIDDELNINPLDTSMAP